MSVIESFSDPLILAMALGGRRDIQIPKEIKAFANRLKGTYVYTDPRSWDAEFYGESGKISVQITPYEEQGKLKGYEVTFTEYLGKEPKLKADRAEKIAKNTVPKGYSLKVLERNGGKIIFLLTPTVSSNG